MLLSHDDLYLHKHRRIIERQICGSTDDTVLDICAQNRDSKKYSEIVDWSIDLLPLASVCTQCSKMTTFRCKKCNSAFYCSRLCQRKSWETHKIICGMSSVSIQSEVDIHMNVDNQSTVSVPFSDAEISSRIKRRYDESNTDPSSCSSDAPKSVSFAVDASNSHKFDFYATDKLASTGLSSSDVLQRNSGKRLLGIEEVDEETPGDDEWTDRRSLHQHSHRESVTVAEECLPCASSQAISVSNSCEDEGVITLMSLLGSTEKDARYALKLYKDVDAAANWLISKGETEPSSTHVSPERSYAFVAAGSSAPSLMPAHNTPERSSSLFSNSTQDVSWMGLSQDSFRPDSQQQAPLPLLKQDYQGYKLDAPANMAPLFSNNEGDECGEFNSFGFTTPPRNSNSYLNTSQSAANSNINHPLAVNTGTGITSTHLPFSNLWKDEVETRAKQKREKSAVMLCEALGISFDVAMNALDRCDGDSDRAAEWVLTGGRNAGEGYYTHKSTNFDSID